MFLNKTERPKMEAKGLRRFSTGFPLVIFVRALLISAATPVFASDTVEAQEIVNQARATFKDFMADESYSWLHEHLKDAKGLLIFPLVLKAESSCVSNQSEV